MEEQVEKNVVTLRQIRLQVVLPHWNIGGKCGECCGDGEEDRQKIENDSRKAGCTCK